MRQTFSEFTMIGTLKEKSSVDVKNNIDIIQKSFEDGATYSIAKGRIVMECNGGEYSLDIYAQDHWKSLTDNGKHKKNITYDRISALAETEIGSKLEITIETNRFNDYKNKRGNVSSIDCFSVKDIRTASEDAEEYFEGKIEGVINKIMPEIVREEETGRLKVEFVGVSFKEEALPHQIFVPADLKDSFEDIYHVGDTTVLEMEILSKSYGKQQKSGGMLGGRHARVNDGFTRTEWCVVNGDDIYDEDTVNKSGESLIIDPKDIKSAMEERAVRLEAIENDTTTKATKSSGLKGSAKFTEVTNPEDCPF